MSSTENFVNSVMRTTVASLCQAIGWNSAQSSTIDVLNDVLKRYFLEIAKRTHSYAEHYGRSEPNLDDAALVFDDMNISIPELEEYVQNFDPVPFPVLLPVFPAEKESNLCFLRPGSQEVLTRPVHVHEYMPPMLVADEEDIKSRKDNKSESNDWQGSGEKLSQVNNHSNSNNNDSDAIISIANATGRKSPTSPLTNGHGVEEDKDIKSNDDFLDNNPSTPSPPSPNSPRTPKSSKRLDSPGENPALKRVRMMLEEEGHPLREITSVMMTSSGFLTSSREGKLPDSKPPPNRDFFEPIPPPAVEKKRKIPTMKKIVEGVKKIEKEKENQDKGESSFSLFEKPDKIFSSSNQNNTSSSSVAPLILEKITEKDGIIVEKVREEKGDIGVKERKSKSDKNKSVSKSKNKLLSSSSSSKKGNKGDRESENRDKQKLKIFKKKKVAKAKEILKKDKKPMKMSKLPKTPEQVAGLDLIDSEDEFGAIDSANSHLPHPPSSGSDSQLFNISKRTGSADAGGTPSLDKKAKKKKEKLVPPIKVNKVKDKKLVKAHQPGIKLSSSKLARLAKFDRVEPNIFENPDKIVPVLMGSQKKKRGRPKKSAPSPFPLGQLGLPPHGIDSSGLPPPMKTMKFNRKLLESSSRDEMDMKSFVPEISIDESRPALHPPDFGLLRNLPLQPGLIPAFMPTPSLKIPSQMPPSISITPATPTIVPSPPTNPPTFKENSRSSSSQFTNLPSSVCSSVTITRIDMSNSQKLPTPYDSQSTPGIGAPNLQNVVTTPTKSSSSSSSSSSANKTPTIQSDSGITITPIVLEKQQQQQQLEQQPQTPSSSVKEERVEKSHAYSSSSGLAKLEQNMRTKEQKRKDKEKRKEQKKEKKEKRKEKIKDKGRKVEKVTPVEKERGESRDKSAKKDKKDKDKSEKKKKNKDKESSAVVEATVPKLTLKLQQSTNTTPADSPNPPQTYHGDSVDHPPPKKITFKPIEEIKQRSPTPEIALARFSPLVTRPSKKVAAPKKSPPVSTPKAPKHEIVSFPSSSSSAAVSSSSSKRGRGRPRKGEETTPVRPPKSTSSTKSSKASSAQAGLVTETVGSYVDEHGNTIWICPACGRQDDGSPMIGCEKCDDWYHFPCVGIEVAPDDNESWYCKKCNVKEKANDHRRRSRQ